MKRKIKIGTLLWSLLFALGTIGLSGCDKDDEYLGEDVYEGYIVDKGNLKDIGQDPDEIIIKITNTPFNITEMPKKDELLSVSLADFPTPDLKVNQKLSFNILSAKGRVIPDLYTSTGFPSWVCKIQIIKLY